MASATEWHALPEYECQPRSWLLSTGDVITEPRLETSGSGRRVRLPGNHKSFVHSDARELSYTGAIRLAESAGAQIICEISDDDEALTRELPTCVDPLLHILNEDDDVSNSYSTKATTWWWHYRHPTLRGVELTISIKLADVYGYGKRKRVVTTVIKSPHFVPEAANYENGDSHSADGLCYPVSPGAAQNFVPIGGRGGYGVEKWWVKFEDLEVVRTRNFMAPQEYVGKDREAVRDLLRRLRVWVGADSMQIPNFAKLAYPGIKHVERQPETLKLALVSTNCTKATIESLVAYLDGTDHAKRAITLYKELRTELRMAGLVTGSLQGNQFLAMLMGLGKPVVVEVENPPLSGDDHPGVRDAEDGIHKITIDLVTGRFIVNCSTRKYNEDDVLNRAGDSWQQAITIASIGGAESELLAYARHFAVQEQEESVARLLREGRDENDPHL